MTNPFVRRQSFPTWLIPVSVLALATGMLISMSWITESNRRERWGSLPMEVRGGIASGDLDLSEEYRKLKTEVTALREEKTRLEALLAKGTDASATLNQSLQETKQFAGLTALTGPGLTVTLSDSKKNDDVMLAESGIIHDLDVLKTVNELWNAGAEAVVVNGLRVGPTTNFRCVGTTILVDAQKIASPVVIQAIGDPKTLLGAMNLPGGVLDELRSVDAEMVKVEPAKSIFAPAWGGSTRVSFAKPAEEKSKDAEDRKP